MMPVALVSWAWYEAKQGSLLEHPGSRSAPRPQPQLHLAFASFLSIDYLSE